MYRDKFIFLRLWTETSRKTFHATDEMCLLTVYIYINLCVCVWGGGWKFLESRRIEACVVIIAEDISMGNLPAGGLVIDGSAVVRLAITLSNNTPHPK